MNSGGAPQSHLPSQNASSPTVSCDGSGGGKSATACALFASPRLLHCASLPSGSYAKSSSGSEPEASYSHEPDLGARRGQRPSRPARTRRQAQAVVLTEVPARTASPTRWTAPTTTRKGAFLRRRRRQAARGVKVQPARPDSGQVVLLDRRVEFGVKNKSLGWTRILDTFMWMVSSGEGILDDFGFQFIGCALELYNSYNMKCGFYVASLNFRCKCRTQADTLIKLQIFDSLV
ncbi:hypothetical protein GUJ93_ZPchr0139g33505 [Zizania palustris]|uniref:Uncharacterized protein n=1 Tax=Zizania palustris TaxID=103762 RepID=A0A8J5RF99_ZIZPA|nr:hypothetical protein GUJ93_ZPchr0139g33505 [Zizania palustris]